MRQKTENQAYDDELGRVVIPFPLSCVQDEARAVPEGEGIGQVDKQPHDANAHASHEASLHTCLPGKH